MYLDLNPYLWRWIFLAVIVAAFGLGLLLVAIGRRLRKKIALIRRRAARVRRIPAHGSPAAVN